MARAKCGGWPGRRAEAYLLIPASMHTSLREPHTQVHARAFGLVPDFWFFCITTKERMINNA